MMWRNENVKTVKMSGEVRKSWKVEKVTGQSKENAGKTKMQQKSTEKAKKKNNKEKYVSNIAVNISAYMIY